MEIGCCAPIKDINFVKDLGFDYLECPASEIKESSNKFIKTLNSFLPRNLSIYSNEDLVKLKDVSKKIIKNSNRKGIKIITFGSGNSRKINGNKITKIEEEKWIDFLLFLDKEAIKNKITILIEPLNRKETNFINTVEEAVIWIEKLHLENFGITIDSYHFYNEQKKLSEIIDFKKYIKHAHISNNHQKTPQQLDSKLLEYIKFVKELNCDLSLEIVPYNKKEIYPEFVKKIKGVISDE